MEKGILGIFIVLVFNSCSFLDPGLSVALANYDFNSGRYQDAILKYNKALGEKQHSDWVRYNLGNVYHALGEGTTAMELWAGLEEPDIDLQFARLFNQGVLMFEFGKYELAYQSFRKALGYNPYSLDAKRNLELSLAKLQAGGDSSKSESSESRDRKEGDSHPLTNFLKQLERATWASQEEGQWIESQRDW